MRSPSLTGPAPLKPSAPSGVPAAPSGVPAAQITLLALAAAGGVTLALLLAVIGYRDQRLAFMVVGGLGAAAMAAAILWRPQSGAYLLVVVICTNMSTIFTEQGLPSINKPLVALVFASLLLNRLLTRQPLFRLGFLEWAMIGYGCVWVASGFVAEQQWLVMNRVTDFVKDFIILVSVVAALSQARYWRRALWLVIWSVAALALLGSYQAITGNYGQTFFGFAGSSSEQVLSGVLQYRLIGPLADPNFYGMILAAALPLAIYRFLDERLLLYRLAGATAALVILLALVNTYSRGALVAVFVMGLCLLWERRVRPASLVFVGLAAALLLLFMPAAYTERLQSFTDVLSGAATVQEESSLRGRASEIISGLRMFAEHPLLGVGVGNFPGQYQRYASELGLEYRAQPREAHSLYVELLAETGLLGLAAFSLLFGSLLLRLNQLRQAANQRGDPHTAAWIASLLLSLITYLTASIFLHGDYIRYLWLLVSLAVAANHLYEVRSMRYEV